VAMAVSGSQEFVSPNMDWLSMSAIWHPQDFVDLR
jgi:hypothetical protein